MQKIPLQQQDMAQLTTQIKQWGLELGFQQVGISGVDLGEHPQHLQNWLDKGFHGDLIIWPHTAQNVAVLICSKPMLNA
jgi:epoxyqueuosine reductase